MSHELRTPLNAIAGYTELIELGLRGPVTPEQVTDLQKVRHNQRHLLGLINSVLSFARLDAGRVVYDVANVPLAASLKAVEALIEPQVSARRIAYSCKACDPRVTVRADSEKVQQILINLLGNAVKFTAPGGQVGVDTVVRSRDIDVRVTDTGIGIGADQLHSIFEPFVQANRSLSQSRDGVGLGLAISRELARGMAGDIAVASELRHGSTFTLTLPRGPDRTPLL
jgi:signal transduction histidine kinase